jgi:L-ribulose-5-phosphate 3-epimerase UlaE
VFNNDDRDYYNNNKLYQKQVAKVLSFEEITMSSTEIERRPGALYWKTANLIESQNECIEKCKVKVG